MRLILHRNLTITVVACLILGSFLAFRAAHWIDIRVLDHPDTDPVISRLDNRPIQQRPEVSLGALMEGSFQDDMETWVSDHVPFREGQLTFQASLQQAAIGASAQLFQYDVVPVRYGSEYSICLADSALIHNAKKVGDEDAEAMRGFADMLNTVARENPDVDFVFDILFDKPSSASNPTWDFVSDTFTPEFVDENLVNNIDPRVHVVVDEMVDNESDSFVDEWYRSDHHWRPNRAMSSYNKIASCLGLVEFDMLGETEYITDKWYGSEALHGLCLDYPDYLWEYNIEDLSVKSFVNGNEAPLRYEWGGASPEYNGYGGYYGWPTKEIEYVNSDETKDGKCLVVGLSYASPMMPYLSSQFGYTMRIDIVNKAIEKSLDDYIQEYDIDTCVIQLAVSEFRTILQNSPVYCSAN